VRTAEIVVDRGAGSGGGALEPWSEAGIRLLGELADTLGG